MENQALVETTNSKEKKETPVLDKPIQIDTSSSKHEQGKKSEKSVTTPYKKVEFNIFLDLLRGEAVHHWGQIARVLGVDQDTISDWKNHPAAQKALRDGIEQALEGMTKAGSSDWRMWESKLKMMGISPVEKQEQDIDISSRGKRIKSITYIIPSTPDTKDGNDETSAKL